jgi:hypothetical protein
MKRFFFDIDDGNTKVRDEHGVKAASLAEVRAEAVAALPDILQELSSGEDEKRLAISVRDEMNQVVLRLTVTIDIAMLG